MAAVRRGAGAILRYLTPLWLLAVLVQIFLAGSGIFGIEEGQGLEEADSLDPHRDVGHIIAEIGALLFLILALLWWPRDKRLLGLYIALALLLFPVQVLLAEGGQWVGAFHPLNGILILGLLAYLSYTMWRGQGRDESMTREATGSTAAR